MSDQILIVIPCHSGDIAQAERMVDFCYQIGGREQRGHCLIVFANDVHDEMKLKLKLAAGVTFLSVEAITVPEITHHTKYEQCNHLFKVAGEHIVRNFDWPFVWMEPDCVPLHPDWIGHLSDAYKLSPKRFVGPHLTFKHEEKDKMCLARTSIYPCNAVFDIGPFCATATRFEFGSSQFVHPRSSKNRLIQYMEYDDAHPEKVREDAVLLHSDKTGKLIERLMSQYEPKRKGRPKVEKELANA